MGALAGFFGALALSGAVPQSGQDPNADVLNEIIVEGRRLEQQARAFHAEVGAPPPGTRTARWEADLCISVSNLRPDMAQFMIDRIAVAAIEAGADVAGPGCRPNVVIMATNDGQGLARQLVRDVRQSFRPYVYGGTDLGRGELERFQASDRAVRWWHVTMPHISDTGDIALREPGGGPEGMMMGVSDVSRLRSNIVYRLTWVIVILDMDKMGGVPFGALSDYLAMVTLTQANPNADLSGADTIMNLFDEPETVTGLTSWDRSYLTSLYDTPLNASNHLRQDSMIAYRMVRERQAVADETAEAPPADTPPVATPDASDN